MKQAADNKINLPLVVDDNVDLDMTTITTVIEFTHSTTYLHAYLFIQSFKVWNDWNSKIKNIILNLNNIIVEKDDQLAKLSLKLSSKSNGDGNETVTSDDPLSTASTTKVVEKESLQATIIELNSKIRKYERDFEDHMESVRVANNKVAQLEQLNLDSNSKYETINSQLTNKITSLEEKILGLQMIINNNKGKDDGRDREVVALKRTIDTQSAQLSQLSLLIEEKNIAVKSNKDFSAALQQRLTELEPELEKYKEKVKEMERNIAGGMLLQSEKDALVASLKKDLRAALDGTERLKELEEFKVKAEGQLIKFGSLQEQVTSLTTQLEDKVSLITRLRSEKESSERNHAMRTAMLATCEAQLEELKNELATKDQTIRDTIERVNTLQINLTNTEHRLDERVRESNGIIKSLEQSKEELEIKFNQSTKEMIKSHELAIDNLKKDYAKKSALARTLMSEKEEEARVLSSKVTELQAEINSGAPSERRIFEIASNQAKREATHNRYSDTREVAFQQLQNTLASKDLDLACAQQSYSDLVNEVVELRRTTRRESVNMDYLKNIVVQYMSFPSQSPEKVSLVPVIAMLLQFSPKEMSDIERAGSNIESITTLPVKEIKNRVKTVSSK
jgi:chromosome segregation ATPase